MPSEPTAAEIETATPAHIAQRTEQLRWHNKHPRDTPRLQQAWRIWETDELIWEDVPTVTDDAGKAWETDRTALAPCGECHLKPGEVCDICGALVQPETGISYNRRTGIGE